jgi:hypothetical protein
MGSHPAECADPQPPAGAAMLRHGPGFSLTPEPQPIAMPEQTLAPLTPAFLMASLGLAMRLAYMRLAGSFRSVRP